MPNLLEGKLALILGIANKWSLAYAIAQAFRREGASGTATQDGNSFHTDNLTFAEWSNQN